MSFAIDLKGWLQKQVCRGRWCGTQTIGIGLIVLIGALLPSAVIDAASLVGNAAQNVSGTQVPDQVEVKEIAHLSITRDVDGLAWSPNGKYLAALSYWGSTLTIWDTETWVKVNEFVRREGGAIVEYGLDFSSDYTVLTSTMMRASFDPNYDDQSKYFNLMEWDIRTGKYLRSLPSTPIRLPDMRDRSRMQLFTVSGDQRFVAGVSRVLENTIAVLDLRTGKAVFARSIPIDWGVDLSASKASKTEGIRALSLSADGRYLAVGTSSEQRTRQNKTLAGGGRVYILDTMTGKTLNSFWAYRWEPDFELDHTDADGWVVYRPRDIYRVCSIALSPDGQWVVTGKDRLFNTKTGNTIAATIWNARIGAKVTDMEGDVYHDGAMVLVDPIKTMAWHDDWLAMINQLGSVRVYSLQDPSHPRLLFKSKGYWMAINTRLAVSGGGLVAYSNGNHIHVLKVNNH